MEPLRATYHNAVFIIIPKIKKKISWVREDRKNLGLIITTLYVSFWSHHCLTTVAVNQVLFVAAKHSGFTSRVKS